MVVSTDIESITWGETAGSESLILSPRATLGFDRTGRPTGLYENGLYTARGLDGRCLEKKWLWDPGRPDARRHIRALDDREREALRARLKTLLQSAQNAALAGTPLRRYDRGREIPADPAQLTQKIEKLTAFLDREWEADPRRFAEVWNPIGILPPDQYLSLVIQVVEGCAWNQCTFCDFYAARPFRVRTREEIDRHTDAAVRYFGDGLEGRCAVFLGDANALQAPPALLIPLAESLAQRFPRLARPQADGVGGLYAFAETARTAAWSPGELRSLATAGFRRAYLGVETGDDALRRLLRKPGSSADALRAMEKLKSAGVALGLIVLLGAGGRDHAAGHARATADLLSRAPLGPGDFVYFSPLVEADAPASPALTEEEKADQRRWIEGRVPSRGERRALYDIREFLY
jgi:radical SAM superfamily enzyme YgiQ (UPF0313 family)